MIVATRSRNSVYLWLALAVLVGGGGLLTFMLFLFGGPFNLVSLGLSEILALLFDLSLCLVFFVQHSGMAQKVYQRWPARSSPEQYSGPVYAVASGVVILILVVFWQESVYTLFEAKGLVRWFFRAAFVMAIAGVAWTIWSLGLLVNFHLSSTVAELRKKEPRATTLVTHGPYRWIRHPLYLSALLMIWSYPDLTLDRLLLNLTFTAWVITGSLIEERYLVTRFGEEYRDYQKRVPMLLPLRLPVDGLNKLKR